MGAEGSPLMRVTTPPDDARTTSEIRRYLLRYSIGTVEVDLTEPGAPLVVRYLQAVLGQPESVGSSDVWFDVQSTLARSPQGGSGSGNQGTVPSQPTGT